MHRIRPGPVTLRNSNRPLLCNPTSVVCRQLLSHKTSHASRRLLKVMISPRDDCAVALSLA